MCCQLKLQRNTQFFAKKNAPKLLKTTTARGCGEGLLDPISAKSVTFSVSWRKAIDFPTAVGLFEVSKAVV